MSTRLASYLYVFSDAPSNESFSCMLFCNLERHKDKTHEIRIPQEQIVDLTKKSMPRDQATLYFWRYSFAIEKYRFLCASFRSVVPKDGSTEMLLQVDWFKPFYCSPSVSKTAPKKSFPLCSNSLKRWYRYRAGSYKIFNLFLGKIP